MVDARVRQFSMTCKADVGCQLQSRGVSQKSSKIVCQGRPTFSTPLFRNLRAYPSFSFEPA